MEETLVELEEEHSVTVEDVVTVSQLNEQVSELIETYSRLDVVHVLGEVSNLSMSSNSHLFFDLRDEESKISCVVFNGRRTGIEFEPEEGDEVLVVGEVEYYEKAGRVSVKPSRILPVGEGLYYRKRRKLMQKLESEGLFDEEHKQPVSEFPERIGVVTSKDGAAVQDVVDTVRSRDPGVDVYVRHSQVQGDGAAQEVKAGIEFFDQEMEVDAVVVTRGGGSIEDLEAFNSEEVARAVFESETPVVSGVGHRTDETVAGHAADYRAITPTAAGKHIVPDGGEVRQEIQNLRTEVEDVYDQFKTMKEQEEAVEGVRWRERKYQIVIAALLLVVILLAWMAL